MKDRAKFAMRPVWRMQVSAENKADPNREAALRLIEGIEGFDYRASAELFSSRFVKGKGCVTYKRFATAAEAIRFAIEEISLPALRGICLEVDEARYGGPEIQYLYEKAGYPLKRRAVRV